MRALGFGWVTLHPTFAVIDVDPPAIRSDNVPDAGPVVAEARRLGLRVRMEPHLDFESTLTGRFEWRKRMMVDPSAEYFDKVLEPLVELTPDELTLGSELDDSAHAFAGQWRDVFDRLEPMGVALGHKLNHDWTWSLGLWRYLRKLDYVAVSFYTPEPWRLDEKYVVGEFGLGSTDESRPWYFGEDLRFRSEADFAARRGWYQRFLRWLSGRDGRAASFWTVGQFDVLGLFDPQWLDEGIVASVRDYNDSAADKHG